MKITKIILYWIMVAAIVTGAVYSYQKVQFGRKIAMLYQLATGNTAIGGPGGAPPGEGQMGMREGGPPGMGRGGEQGGVQPGQTGVQPPKMGQNMQRGPSAGTTSEGGQGLTEMQGGAQGQFPGFQPGGEEGRRGNFQPGGREGRAPGGGPGGPPGGSWYKVSLRNVGPYTCILAFFVLLTCIIDKSIKRLSRKKSEC